MRLQQFIQSEEYPVRRVDDAGTVVADLGRGTDASVDIVGEVALVTVDGETTEIDLPSEPEQVFIRNGVLTIDLEEDQ